jgi:DNA topoisomerase-1
MGRDGVGRCELYENGSDGEGGRHSVPAAVKAVANKLGNTPAICRKCYIHPAIVEGPRNRCAGPASALLSGATSQSPGRAQ